MRILILCTGNSCRSQMAEGVLKNLDSGIRVHSAGTHPSSSVHPLAIAVMKEIGLDISENRPKKVDDFISQEFDYVITVCGGAKESCPMFTGKVKNRLHIDFADPAEAKGTDEEITSVFRKVRDEIKEAFTKFYDENIT